MYFKLCQEKVRRTKNRYIPHSTTRHGTKLIKVFHTGVNGSTAIINTQRGSKQANRSAIDRARAWRAPNRRGIHAPTNTAAPKTASTTHIGANAELYISSLLNPYCYCHA